MGNVYAQKRIWGYMKMEKPRSDALKRKKIGDEREKDSER